MNEGETFFIFLILMTIDPTWGVGDWRDLGVESK